MKKKKWVWFIGILTIAVLSIIFYQWFSMESSKTISEQEASELVTTKYSGKISQVQLTEDDYIIKLEKNSGLYEVKVNIHTGEISSLTQIKKNQTNIGKNNVLNEEQIKRIATSAGTGKLESLTQTLLNNQLIFTAVLVEKHQRTYVKVDAHTGKVLSINTEKLNEPSKRITKQEAIKIAIRQVPGEVDEVKIKSIDNLTYYFVEIDTKDDREATIQIQAITGEVKSVTWDD
ncbi:PepSY domain-containing protein [Bacillus sp. FJAT-49732]|uniref:PepSY domain-containing protein n=1 Tax=Lederbergia citrisecunda TaxID=2833583 RepID=A0A942YPA2_9BACI|nr:PepSY domain-containing protein [Lederbergia citrisecunda]MBS4201096.1 PepSY domain-containing protein [Lederbergia citrisecunda]